MRAADDPCNTAYLKKGYIKRSAGLRVLAGRDEVRLGAEGALGWHGGFAKMLRSSGLFVLSLARERGSLVCRRFYISIFFAEELFRAFFSDLACKKLQNFQNIFKKLLTILRFRSII